MDFLAKSATENPRSQLLLERSGSKIDPFAHYPIDITPELDALLERCFKPWNSDFRGIERHLFPESRYRSVLAHTGNDAALLVALLSLVATQTSLLRNGKVDELALRLQNQTIRLQARACLRNDPSDARITTALAIMSNHLATGNPEKMLPHMKAVGSFVQQRGGIQYLGMDGILADNIMYGDHTKIVIYNARPNYPLPMPSLQPIERRVTFSRHLGQAFMLLRDTEKISDGVYQVARDIAMLTDIYNRAIRASTHEQERTYFKYLAIAVEYQLAELNAIHHDTNTIEEMCTVAFLLVNHVIYRNYGNISPIVPILEQRFWRCFEGLWQSRDHQRVIPGSDRFFIWLGLTGVISQTRRKCPYIKTAVSALLDIRRGKQHSGLQTFDEVKEKVLDLYLWSQPIQEHVFRPVWEEMLESEQISHRTTAKSLA